MLLRHLVPEGQIPKVVQASPLWSQLFSSLFDLRFVLFTN